MTHEYDVYRALIEFLSNHRWQIICASPPGGTNGRYPKCILPRRSPKEKGPRDEVDLSASRGDLLLFAECKVRLSESFSRLTGQQESDYDKLKRVMTTRSSAELARLISRAYGVRLQPNPKIGGALVVNKVDAKVPQDMTVIELSGEVRVWSSEPFDEAFR